MTSAASTSSVDSSATGGAVAEDPTPAAQPAELVELDVEGEPERSGTGTRAVAAGAALVVGAAALVNSYRLGLGSPTAPGAGLWPACASATMVLAAALLLIGVRRSDDCERFGRGTLTIGAAAVSLAGFVLLFGGFGAWPGIGFEWAMAVLLVFWLKVIGRESWRVTAAVTVGCVAAMHLFFIEALGAPIPHVIGW